MEWLFKFAEKSKYEREKIIFHILKFFIVSTFSFIIYRYFFGEFIIIDFTFKNAIDFINSKYFYYSSISFIVSWVIYFIINEIQKKIVCFFSKKANTFLNKYLKNELTYKDVKTAIKVSNLLIKIKLLKLDNNRISLSKQLIIIKDSLTESQEKRDESERSYFIMSVCFLILAIDVYYYINSLVCFFIFAIFSFFSFILAAFFSFSLKNKDMVLAIIRSIKNFIERYEFNRDNKPIS